MNKRKKNDVSGYLAIVVIIAFIAAILIGLYLMFKVTKGPWRWIFVGLLAFGIATYLLFEWSYGFIPFIISAPVLCLISDYQANPETKISIPIIITCSVVWPTLYFAFIF